MQHRSTDIEASAMRVRFACGTHSPPAASTSVPMAAGQVSFAGVRIARTRAPVPYRPLDERARRPEPHELQLQRSRQTVRYVLGVHHDGASLVALDEHREDIAHARELLRSVKLTDSALGLDDSPQRVNLAAAVSRQADERGILFPSLHPPNQGVLHQSRHASPGGTIQEHGVSLLLAEPELLSTVRHEVGGKLGPALVGVSLSQPHTEDELFQPKRLADLFLSEYGQLKRRRVPASSMEENRIPMQPTGVLKRRRRQPRCLVLIPHASLPAGFALSSPRIRA